jgi:hypothetical protein
MQTGLYKRQDMPQLRAAMQQALLQLLCDSAWDGARDAVLDVLWGVSEGHWTEFVQSCIPSLCCSCNGGLRQHQEQLTAPFLDASQSLSDFAHFQQRIDDLTNDLAFFAAVHSGSDNV